MQSEKNPKRFAFISSDDPTDFVWRSNCGIADPAKMQNVSN
jgi:hypothetical protein